VVYKYDTLFVDVNFNTNHDRTIFSMFFAKSSSGCIEEFRYAMFYGTMSFNVLRSDRSDSK